LKHVFLWTLGVHTGGSVLAGASHRVEQLGQRNGVRTEPVGMRDDLVLALGAADRCDL
jgi:hypothetical protein